MATMDSSEDARRTPQRGEKLTLIGASACIVWGILEVVTGGIVVGTFMVAVGSVTTGGVARQAKRRRDGGATSSFHIMKAYAFLAVCFVVCTGGGLALFVIALLGDMRDPALYSVVGLAAAGIGIFVVATVLRDRIENRKKN